jgi:hypothetical protein
MVADFLGDTAPLVLKPVLGAEDSLQKFGGYSVRKLDRRGLIVYEIVRYLVLVTEDQENKTSPISITRVEYLEGDIYKKIGGW